MAQFDDVMKNQIAAILRVINYSKCFKEDNIPCLIEEGLFLGSVGAANNKNVLKSNNITHILTVANSIAPVYPNDFVYKVIAVADREETNLRQYFEECINFIDEAKRQGGGVLVHCFVGRSRSVTIILAYLMKKRGMTVSQALEHVRSRRPQASPNLGFVLQLREYERLLKDNCERNQRRQQHDELTPEFSSGRD
ncbi:Dual specificity protein phosphatase 1 [Linum grandiflorum]